MPVPASPASWDAVICRNVLLYFERDHAISIIRSLNAATTFLLLSPVEQPLAWSAQASRIDVGQEVVLLRSHPVAPVAPTRASSRQHRARTVPGMGVVRAPTTQVHELVGRACNRLAEGALDDAIALCDAAIEGDRLFSAAHLAKGLALKRGARFGEAVPVLRCARFLTHDEAWLAPYTLARCLERVAEPEGAVEAYRHALAIIEGGGASGLSPWDPSMDAFARTIADACKARLAAIKPIAGSGLPIRLR